MRYLPALALLGFMLGASELHADQTWQFGGNPYTPYSDLNPYSNTANPYNPDGLNNPYSQYGNPYSTTGRLNPYADGLRVRPADAMADDAGALEWDY